MVKEIDAQDVKKMIEGDERVVIVDALPPKSFSLRHIPGAVNVPAGADNVDDLIEQRLPEDKSVPIVCYCSDPECEASPALAHMLEEHHGYTHVYEFPGGLKGWHDADYDFERPQEEPKPV